MKAKFRLYRRGASGRFYIQDNTTGHQESLGTSDRAEALRLLCARNEAAYQPAFNNHIARTYLSAGDPELVNRTWQDVMDALVASKKGRATKTQERYQSFVSEKALDPIRKLPILNTTPEQLTAAIKEGTVSTNMFLRRLHGYAVSVKWLPWPILTWKQWPPIKFKPRRGITREEHEKIIARENNPERRAFYELLWHIGSAQIDLAMLTAEAIDWEKKVIRYYRRKTGKLSVVRFGETVAAILRGLPTSGPLFPNWSKLTSAHRADRFHTRCESVGVKGVSLHSYRYAWAERAAEAGYPERFAQHALGHASAAVHRAYAKNARVELPPLDEYEKEVTKS